MYYFRDWQSIHNYVQTLRESFEEEVAQDPEKDLTQVAFMRAILNNDEFSAVGIYVQMELFDLRKKPQKSYDEAARMEQLLALSRRIHCGHTVRGQDLPPCPNGYRI